MKYGIVAVVLAMVLTACAGQTAGPSGAVRSTPPEDLNTVFQPGATPTAVSDDVISAADAEYLLLTNLYQRLSPSVVNIEVIVRTAIGGRSGRGSGFIYDTNGHVITNAHVVDGAVAILVTFNDGYVAEARLVGSDVFSDLAVVRIEVDATRLRPVTMGDSDAVRVGQRAIAIGNPFGLASSMTVGIVSGLGRQLPSAELLSNTVTPGFQNPSIIQVDTDINPGNSGGPLFNSQGEVIGVNTAIRTESGVFEGVGFAVPSATVKRVVPELIANGQVVYPWLGITSMPAENGMSVAALAEPLRLPVSAGILIDTVAPASPAAKAGLRGGSRIVRVRGTEVCTGGDIIVAINDRYVANMDELLSYLVVNGMPGDTVTLLVVREGETFDVPVILEPRPTEGAGIPAICGG
jgi:S1-C subfamily serine protease